MRKLNEDRTSTLGDLGWRIVGLLNLYRLVAPPVLFAIYRLTLPQPTVGAEHPRLFLTLCVLYFFAGWVLVLAQRLPRIPRRLLLLTHALVDSVAIGLLLYASGGVASGLGILLVVPVGAVALLAEGRRTLLMAAIAVVSVLVQQVLGQLGGAAAIGDYPAAGVLGVVLFLVALVSWPLTARLQESEALIKRREVDLANLAELSQYIVQHLRESLLVVDHEDRIRLINESAARILGDRSAFPGALLGEASPRLLYLLSTWRQSGERPKDTGATFVASNGANEILPHFAPLGSESPPPVIVFLEDTTEIAGKLQQLKLASLGRLSASIAHEIRNPVGAMSHAAQLLGESVRIGDEERRLAEIIRTNATRVSEIITNVQSMSRREPVRAEQFGLGGWLKEFRTEFCATLPCPEALLALHEAAGDIEVRCDRSQLRQIVWNLAHNAVKHNGDAPHPIELRTGKLSPTQRPFLEVVDRGQGIPEALADRIFEPFVTGESRGTGLGLFLARELAQANGATLIYEPRPGGGSIFRLVFSDPLRWQA
jgi:two-component system sensor histidine kinase PilS (NtrC family)